MHHEYASGRIPAFEYSQLEPWLWAGRNPLFGCDVQELVRLRIAHVLDLRERREWTVPYHGQEALAALEEAGIARIHLPVTDMAAPTPDTLTRTVSLMTGFSARQERLYVHCRAGIERTAAILLAWRAFTRDEDISRSLEALRAGRPRLKPLPAQLAAVEAWLFQARGSEVRQ